MAKLKKSIVPCIRKNSTEKVRHSIDDSTNINTIRLSDIRIDSKGARCESPERTRNEKCSCCSEGTFGSLSERCSCGFKMLKKF